MHHFIWFWGLLRCHELYCGWSLHNQNIPEIFHIDGFLGLTVNMPIVCVVLELLLMSLLIGHRKQWHVILPVIVLVLFGVK